MSGNSDLSQSHDRIVEVNRFALTTFHEVVESAKKVEQEAQGTEYQHYIEQFSHSIIESTAKVLLVMSTGITGRIAEEAMGSSVSPGQPKKDFVYDSLFNKEARNEH